MTGNARNESTSLASFLFLSWEDHRARQVTNSLHTYTQTNERAQQSVAFTYIELNCTTVTIT